MAERITTTYARLFEVRVLHHYWLDDGATPFDALPAATQESRLLAYDMRPWLAVVPTATTAAALRGLRAVFKSTSLGWVVAVPADAQVPDEAVFDFMLVVQHADFFTYTAGTLLPRRRYTQYYPPENQVYCYLENAPVLSNLTGTMHGAEAGQALFLARKPSPLAPDDQAEALVLAGPALAQLTSSQPGAATQVLYPEATAAPVYVHQHDAPAIVPPSGLAGAPARGARLPADAPPGTWALVRLAAVRPGEAAFSCTSGGRARATPPIFQLRLKNRSTYRRYLNRSTGEVLSTEPAPLPLTRFGNAGTRQPPTTNPVQVALDEAVPGRITRVFSDVFEQLIHPS